MPRAALLLALSVILACSRKDEVPTLDSAAAMATVPGLDVAGKWSVNVMPEGKDTILITYMLDATNSRSGWKMTLPNRKPMDMRVISMDHDSIVVDVGPYASALQENVKVRNVHSAVHLEGGKLVGTAVVTYDKKGPDSIVVMRQEGSRE